MKTSIKDSSILGNKHFLAAVAGVIAFLIYANTIPNFYNLDDELITANHILTDNSFTAFKKIFTEPYYKDEAGNKYEYRPVVLVSYFFEFMFLGRNPHVSHFINVLVYSATCILLFYLMLSLFRDYLPSSIQEKNGGRKLSGQPSWLSKISPSLALAASITIFFAVHPLHTEAVASIKNRDEILALLFGLLSWHCALRLIDSRHITFFFLYLLFFTTGLFSKQTSITFAILIPISVILFRMISLQLLLALILPVILISTIFSPVYLIYKKALLFFGQLIFLMLFHYFMLRRDVLINFFINIITKTKSLLSATVFVIKKYFRAYSISLTDGFIHFKAKINALLPTLLIFILIAGALAFYGKKKEAVKNASWHVKDAIQDFNELQLVPALQTPAPSVIPIAGRRLNYVELPLLYEESSGVKLATALSVTERYLRLLIVPYPLRFYYGFNQIPLMTFANYLVWASLLIHVAITLFMIWLLIKRTHPVAAFGLIYYLLMIIPLSNLLTPIAGVVAERLAYAPSLGYCIVFCYIIINNLYSEAIRSRTKYIVSLLFGLLLLTFAVMTISRNRQWKDHLTLMRHDIRHLDRSARANHLLASHLAVKATEKRQPNLPENRQMLQESLQYFIKALDIYPEFPNAWYEIAKVHLMLNDPKSAIDAYFKAAAANETFAAASFELGITLEQSDRSKDAEKAYKQAIQRDSMFKQAYINLSYLYYKQARYEESVHIHKAALEKLPNEYDLHLNLGRTYLMMNETNKALESLEKAVAINRSDKELIKMIAQLYESIGNMEKSAYYRSIM